MKAARVLLVVSLLLAFLIATGDVLFSQAEENLSQGLVAYWKFDEGEGDIVFDGTENNNDGMLKCAGDSCSPPKWVEGKIGNALEFDGVDDYVEVANDTSLNMEDRSFTLAAWFRTGISDNNYIISKMGATGHYRLLMHSKVGLYFEISDETEALGIYSQRIGIAYNDNKWHQVAAVRVKGDERLLLYVDGAQIATGTKTIGKIDNTGNLYIGARDPTKNYFHGLIDEVRIYHRALTADEIKALYEQGQGTK